VDKLVQKLSLRLVEFLSFLNSEFGIYPIESNSISELLEFAIHKSKSLDSRVSWLLYAVITGSYPNSDEYKEFHHFIHKGGGTPTILELLNFLTPSVVHNSSLCSSIEILSNARIIDVDFCAKNSHNTGIQRVVRNNVSNLVEIDNNIVLVAWNETYSSWRTLAEIERRRVIEWMGTVHDEESNEHIFRQDNKLIIPWNCQILLPEVMELRACETLFSLAESQICDLTAIGYDMIPLLSPEWVPEWETNRFMSYLSVIKFSKKVAAISQTAAAEFEGYTSALNTQGITGPTIKPILLPRTFDVAELDFSLCPQGRFLLCVGTFEPRKNQKNVLLSSKLLWEKGIDFSLVFVGRGASHFYSNFLEEIDYLQKKQNRSVFVHTTASDEQLAGLYAKAYFSISLSKHEGFGLPIVESLAMGTPVLASSIGSMAEISKEGGCFQVDPFDTELISEAMEVLLTNNNVHTDLVRSIPEHEKNGWLRYSEEIDSFWKLQVE
jgi:glycosyltransferase involved in cell wall biosynthesis